MFTTMKNMYIIRNNLDPLGHLSHYLIYDASYQSEFSIFSYTNQLTIDFIQKNMNGSDSDSTTK